MKKLVVLMFLFVAACTGGSDKGAAPGAVVTTPDNSPEVEINISKLITLDSNLTLDGDFNTTIELVSSADETILEKRVIVKNPTSESKNLSIAVTGNSKMSLSVNRCPTVLPAGQSCTLTVIHRMRQVANNDYTGFLQIMAPNLGIAINSHVSNSSYINPTSDGSVSSDLSVTMSNFDDYVVGTRLTKLITLKNNSESKTVSDLSYSVPSGYKIMLSRCGESLAPLTSCDVYLNFGGNGTPSIDDALSISSGSTVKSQDLITKPTVSNITLSSDKKAIVVSGTNFTKVKSAKLMNGASVVNVLAISVQNGTTLEAKPTANLSLTGGVSYTLRLE